MMARDAATARARADTYRLLGRLCLAEVDARLLGALRATPEFGPALGGDDAALLAALRAEYARLFLLNAPPYESLYVDEALLLNTAATIAVVEAYRDGAYSPAGQVGAPDHVGLELAFVGHLALAEADALTHGDAAAAAQSRARQRAFLAAHLGRWAPVWATAFGRLARQPFYAALGGVVRDFVLAELEAALAAP
ncbi:MAG TPA: molecular chaperone TorD family protein [Chloroflexota bacterium]|nr:molecular chaperone TorD family protein [Chloroflexota bacterium]